MSEAIRAVGDCANDPKHQFGLHPRDYALFELGEWDNSSGVLRPHDSLRRVCHVHELVTQTKDNEQPELELVVSKGAAK